MKIQTLALAFAAALMVAGCPLAPLAAQELSGWSGLEDPVDADRPDFSEGTGTIAPGHVQIEGGYTHSRFEDFDGDALGELLIRIGMGERWEAQIDGGSHVRIDGPGTDVSGRTDPGVGVKLRLTDEAGDLAPGQPAAAIILTTSLPVGDDDLTADEWVPGAKLALDWALSPRFALSANAGYSWQAADDDRFHQLSGSLSGAVAITDRLGAFVEYFGFSEEEMDGPSTDYVDAGVTFLVFNDLSLDAYVGRGLNDADPDWFAGFGGAIRF